MIYRISHKDMQPLRGFEAAIRCRSASTRR